MNGKSPEDKRVLIPALLTICLGLFLAAVPGNPGSGGQAGEGPSGGRSEIRPLSESGGPEDQETVGAAGREGESAGKGAETDGAPEAGSAPRGKPAENAVDLRHVYSKRELEKLLRQAEEEDAGFARAASMAASPSRIIVLPHHRPAAGLAARALSWAAGSWQPLPRTIILLGPNHKNLGSDILALDWSWRTDAGIVEPDEEAFKGIYEAGAASRGDDSFRGEHSVTMALPLVAEYFPGAKVVPLIFRWRCEPEKLARLWQALEPALGPDTLIILSADFSHGLNSEQAAGKDQETLKLLEARDWRSVAALDSSSLDCPTLLGWLVKYAGEKGWGAFTLLSESGSGELLGSREQGVTSYLILSAGGEDDAR